MKKILIAMACLLQLGIAAGCGGDFDEETPPPVVTDPGTDTTTATAPPPP